MTFCHLEIRQHQPNTRTRKTGGQIKSSNEIELKRQAQSVPCDLSREQSFWTHTHRCAKSIKAMLWNKSTCVKAIKKLNLNVKLQSFHSGFGRISIYSFHK